jgi:triosephosphate isomerase
MRRPLVAGNWKMHGTRADSARLVGDLVENEVAGEVDVVICPPFVYLWEIARLIKSSAIALGAQDVCAETPGAFTGEIAASMLKDVGCRYALVGHSERRALYGEDDRLVARKFVAVQREGLVPVLCVGESLDERERGVTEEVVARQLDAVLAVTGPEGFTQALVAYEPVWAIGTGKNASPGQAQDVHAFIRARLAARDAKIAASLRILYGGSVKASNAAELFAQRDVDGGLVGGASLKADEFRKICEAAAATRGAAG